MNLHEAIESHEHRFILFYIPDRGWASTTEQGVDWDSLEWRKSPGDVLTDCDGTTLAELAVIRDLVAQRQAYVIDWDGTSYARHGAMPMAHIA